MFYNSCESLAGPRRGEGKFINYLKIKYRNDKLSSVTCFEDYIINDIQC